MKVFPSLTSLLLLSLFAAPLLMGVRGEEDELEEEEEGVVEEEGGETEEVPEEAADETVGGGGDGKTTTSADADTTLLFTRPVGTNNMELPAGQMVELLIGFTNKGEQEMMVDSLEASLRYPMDFSFHIQNFSTVTFSKTIKPKQQATVAYSFTPADAFAGRPIGLSISLNYRDAAGNFFIDPVFNETVQIVEFDEGFDTETFFMYVCMAGATVLLLFLGFNVLSGKKGRAPKVVETGTDGDDGVDYEWIPKSALRNTPSVGKTSPRQRKAKAGSDSD